MNDLISSKVDCNKCVWGKRGGGCASWDCEFIDRDEAVRAWRQLSSAGTISKKLHPVLSSTESERKRMSNKEWVDFLSEQFTVSRTSAREMLHVMMSVKREDNFKKQFNQGRK